MWYKILLLACLTLSAALIAHDLDFIAWLLVYILSSWSGMLQQSILNELQARKIL